MKNLAYIAEAKRTAVGKYCGSLSKITAPDLASIVIKNILRELPRIRYKIDEVILGNAVSAGIGQNPARIASIRSGLDKNIPSFTVNKVCGSGLKSVILAVQSIQNGNADIILAGGMENMSRCPYYLDNFRLGVKYGHQTIKDGMIYDGLFCSLIGEHMGMTAEYLAKRFKIKRKEQDLYAYESHQKAIKAIDQDFFKNEIVPVVIRVNKNKKITFLKDEQPRRNTSVEKLSTLKPVFKKNGSVTAGNSASLNDGAAIILVVSQKAIQQNKIQAKAVIRSYASVGLDPKYMGLGSYLAAKISLEKAGLTKKDIDLWELNEAFASQSLAVLKYLKINPKTINVNGGALALGHPIGATGAIILTTLISNLKRLKLKRGIAACCIGGGQGIALIIETI